MNTEEKAPLIVHLIELRNRLMVSVLAVLVGFLGCYFFAEEIFEFLVEPLRAASGEELKMVYTGLAEAFFTYMKVAFFAGLFLAMPLIIYQFWAFVAPGLYRHERRAVLPFLLVAPLLFFAGGGLAYQFVFPPAFKFFLAFATPFIEPLLSLREYLSLVITLIFAFGMSFELPVIMLLLIRVGVLSTEALIKKRKYSIILAFVIGGILTPPDPFTQSMLAVPLLAMYEISIFLGKRIERAREKREEENQTDEDDLEEAEDPPR
ncbi:MAG: twin-arginine translocase subunit TatC [Magnetococcales bacterium]|nr:twin-arginine translocase subunit TatC [Magnetococcales bacterium]